MIDIYCEDNKCPICERNLIEKNSDQKRVDCPNKCYTLYKGKTIHAFFIFKSSFQYDRIANNYKPISKILEKEIVKEIEYWKENDRYLMALMEV